MHYGVIEYEIEREDAIQRLCRAYVRQRYLHAFVLAESFLYQQFLTRAATAVVNSLASPDTEVRPAYTMRYSWRMQYGGIFDLLAGWLGDPSIRNILDNLASLENIIPSELLSSIDHPRHSLGDLEPERYSAITDWLGVPLEPYKNGRSHWHTPSYSYCVSSLEMKNLAINAIGREKRTLLEKLAILEEIFIW
jgi:hypothetical protein